MKKRKTDGIFTVGEEFYVFDRKLNRIDLNLTGIVGKGMDTKYILKVIDFDDEQLYIDGDYIEMGIEELAEIQRNNKKLDFLIRNDTVKERAVYIGEEDLSIWQETLKSKLIFDIDRVVSADEVDYIKCRSCGELYHKTKGNYIKLDSSIHLGEKGGLLGNGEGRPSVYCLSCFEYLVSDITTKYSEERGVN